MKIIFVSHDIGIYGASQSLQLLTKTLQKLGVDFYFIINKRLFGKNDLQKVSERFGVNVNQIKEFHLPIDNSTYVGKPDQSYYSFYSYIKQFLWRLNAPFLRRYFRQNEFDIIYLNSLTLHEIISNEFSFIIHIREIYDRTNSGVIESLKMAKGVIYIDQATKDPFVNDGKFQNELLINNPFDQRALREYESKYNDLVIRFKDKHVFSIIGLLKDAKGQHFVISAFLKANIENSILLIVGGTFDPEYDKLCKKIASRYSNVIFWGEEEDINKIYLVSKYVIRGDYTFAIGRTTYEGLYSGCNVIIPGSISSDSQSMPGYDKLKEEIFFYEPRNEQDLVLKMKSAVQKPVKDRVYDSNADEYAMTLRSYFESVRKNEFNETVSGRGNSKTDQSQKAMDLYFKSSE